MTVYVGICSCRKFRVYTKTKDEEHKALQDHMLREHGEGVEAWGYALRNFPRDRMGQYHPGQTRRR
jgi:hypothetical protein